MTSLPAWERLTAIATLGLARTTARLDELWPDPKIVPSGTAQQSLLRAAAASYLWLQAGQRVMASGTGPPLPSAMQPVSAPPIPEAAAWRLGRILSGEHALLLEEWLMLAARHGRTLPPQWVPLVLQHATPAMCRKYRNVLGATAAWLAQLNPAWVDCVHPPQPSQERWNAGTLAERITQLQRVRACDVRQGLAWLQATWASDPPDAREAFLKALQPTVESSDEAFLEAALDDKRKAVRQAAAECLANLSASNYLQRAVRRAEPLLSWQGAARGLVRLLRKPTLEVHLPLALDKAAARDGIEAKPPAARQIGVGVFWLTQLVSRVPPVHWTQRFGCSAGELLETARATPYSQELLVAFSAAAVRHPQAEWLDALCMSWIDTQREPQADVLARLLGAAGEPQSAALLKYLRQLVPARLDVALALLTQLKTPWDAAITELMINALREVLLQDRQQWSHARNTLAAEARQCEVATAGRLLPKLLETCGESSPWRNALEAFQDVLEFRAAMQRELAL